MSSHSHEPSLSRSDRHRRPWGLFWRCSSWYITLVVGIGIGTDLFIYSVVVPVVPFRLESLGYTDVSSKTSYLLLAYSLSLVLSTPPTVWACERLEGRRKTPFLAGLVFLAASLILFMLAPTYALLVIARILQGISSSVIWVVGLALLCDTVPEESVGQQLGLAMTGLTIGFSAGPPVGGALYAKLGFHAPFIFCLGIVAFDFICRLMVIEKVDVLEWEEGSGRKRKSDVDTVIDAPVDVELAMVPPPHEEGRAEGNSNSNSEHIGHPDVSSPHQPRDHDSPSQSQSQSPPPPPDPASKQKVSQWTIFPILIKNPRVVTALYNTAVFGVVMTSEEPTLPLRLNAVWGLTSAKVGLIYMAAIVPTLFSGAIAGHIADRKGPELITTLCFLLAIPWFLLLVLKKGLALFIVSFCFASFFLNGTVAPLESELAVSAREIPGVGYGHVFGMFNMAYSIGSSLGPVIGGQLYDRVLPRSRGGWVILCVLNAVLVLVSALLSMTFTGSKPLLGRMCGRLGCGGRSSSMDGDFEISAGANKRVDVARNDAVENEAKNTGKTDEKVFEGDARQ